MDNFCWILKWKFALSLYFNEIECVTWIICPKYSICQNDWTVYLVPYHGMEINAHDIAWEVQVLKQWRTAENSCDKPKNIQFIVSFNAETQFDTLPLLHIYKYLHYKMNPRVDSLLKTVLKDVWWGRGGGGRSEVCYIVITSFRVD